MSVFSVTAFDRVLDPPSSPMERENLASSDRKAPFSFYPPLYATPTPQRPPSPSSFSPSPYVLNHKRRGPVKNGIVDTRGTFGAQTTGVKQQNPPQDSSNADDGHHAEGSTGISVSVGKFTEASEKHPIMSETERTGIVSAGNEDMTAEVSGQQGESEVFEIEIMTGEHIGKNHAAKIYAQEASGKAGMDKLFKNEASVVHPPAQSPAAGEDSRRLASSITSLTSEEFFDAPDAPHDGSTSEDESLSYARSPIKSSKNLARRLQEEVARRIRAEEAFSSLQQQWNEMARRCSLIGLSLSSGSCQYDVLESGQREVDPVEFLSQKLLVARLVGGAVASASVRAVKEEELESIMRTKNWEISRLRDKLQYYELVNHEMSQRNQEAIEIAQRRRRRRQKRQRLVLGCFSAACCVGTAGLLCYKFAPWEQARTWVQSLTRPPQFESSSTE